MIKHRDIPFYQIPKKLLECGNLTPSAILTLSILMDRESVEEKYHKLDKKGYFWVTKAYIESKLHICKKTIGKCFQDLFKAKLLQRRYVPNNSNGYSKQYFYRINWETVLQFERDEPPSCEASLEEEAVASRIVRDSPNEPPESSEEAMPFFEDVFPSPPDWIAGINDPSEPPEWSEQTDPLDTNGKDLYILADIKVPEEPRSEICESDLRSQPLISDSDFDPEEITL